MFSSDRQRRAAFANMAGGSFKQEVKFARKPMTPDEFAATVLASKTAIKTYSPKNTVAFFKVEGSDPVVVAARAKETVDAMRIDGARSNARFVSTEDGTVIGVAVTSNKASGEFPVYDDDVSALVSNVNVSEVLSIGQDREEQAYELYTAFGGKSDLLTFVDEYKGRLEDFGDGVSKDEVIRIMVMNERVNVKTGEPLERLKIDKDNVISMEDFDKAAFKDMIETARAADIEEVASEEGDE